MYPRGFAASLCLKMSVTTSGSSSDNVTLARSASAFHAFSRATLSLVACASRSITCFSVTIRYRTSMTPRGPRRLQRTTVVKGFSVQWATLIGVSIWNSSSPSPVVPPPLGSATPPAASSSSSSSIAKRALPGRLLPAGGPPTGAEASSEPLTSLATSRARVDAELIEADSIPKPFLPHEIAELLVFSAACCTRGSDAASLVLSARLLVTSRVLSARSLEASLVMLNACIMPFIASCLLPPVCPSNDRPSNARAAPVAPPPPSRNESPSSFSVPGATAAASLHAGKPPSTSETC
mmetsp:Transcript_62865/g.149805  ORF Transcript_62865/g.149805 Transcript_62865/m.149805 type:complete len:294 (-) Transcript_62865:1056-1937(-)